MPNQSPLAVNLPSTPSVAPVDVQVLKVAFTPDPDDAYAWWAVCFNRMGIRGYRIETILRHIQEINESCRARQEYDIAAISSAAYPFISANYAILSAGASVGRGYGPALASKHLQTEQELTAGKRVGIPGELTTGALLLRLFFPGVQTVELPFDQVAPAIIRGEIDAGVLIHEELLNWRAAGLRKLACLGQKWTESSGLPLPVGLNVVRRALGKNLIRRIGSLVRESMQEANCHSAEASKFAMTYSREAESEIGSRFITMFANQDTIKLDADCLKALAVLYQSAHERGLIERVPVVDVI